MTAPARRSNTRQGKRRLSVAPASASAGEKTFKIGEAAALLGVKPYVLRFWETQFQFLRPGHTQSKHRVYTQKDVDTLKLIKRLLYEERFTIEGAKKHIREFGLEGSLSPRALKARAVPSPEPPASGNKIRKTLSEIRRDLESLHKLLQH